MKSRFTYHTLVQTVIFVGGILLDYAVLKVLGTTLLSVALAAVLGLLFGIAFSMVAEGGKRGESTSIACVQ